MASARDALMKLLAERDEKWEAKLAKHELQLLDLSTRLSVIESDKKIPGLNDEISKTISKDVQIPTAKSNPSNEPTKTPSGAKTTKFVNGSRPGPLSKKRKLMPSFVPLTPSPSPNSCPPLETSETAKSILAGASKSATASNGVKSSNEKFKEVCVDLVSDTEDENIIPASPMVFAAKESQSVCVTHPLAEPKPKEDTILDKSFQAPRVSLIEIPDNNSIHVELRMDPHPETESRVQGYIIFTYQELESTSLQARRWRQVSKINGARPEPIHLKHLMPNGRYHFKVCAIDTDKHSLFSECKSYLKS